MKTFVSSFTVHVSSLKLPNLKLIIHSLNRKTSFIGFVIDLNSVLNINKKFIETQMHQYVPTNKCSQDNLQNFIFN